jgi:cell division protein FtsB
MVKRWWFRAVVVAVLILIFWVLYVSSKQIERNRRIQAEISSLETEAAKIRRENETLSEKISYFASDDFREQEAKKKLGLKKTEEIVVGVKPAVGDKEERNESVGTEQTSSESEGNEANYKKWWSVFFGAY